MSILLVEDEMPLAKAIINGLKYSGFLVNHIDDGLEAEKVITNKTKNQFDCILLDIGLPSKNGFEILKSMRNRGIKTPVIILTAFDDIEDKVKGLDFGADDYLTKPFEMIELAARLRSIIRRNQKNTDSSIKYKNIEVDPVSFTIRQNGEYVPFSKSEFYILQCLLENVGKVVSRTKLEAKLYGYQESIDSNTLDVYIHHIRKKLQDKIIKTIRGIGYIVK